MECFLYGINIAEFTRCQFEFIMSSVKRHPHSWSHGSLPPPRPANPHTPVSCQFLRMRHEKSTAFWGFSTREFSVSGAAPLEPASPLSLQHAVSLSSGSPDGQRELPCSPENIGVSIGDSDELPAVKLRGAESAGSSAPPHTAPPSDVLSRGVATGGGQFEDGTPALPLKPRSSFELSDPSARLQLYCTLQCTLQCTALNTRTRSAGEGSSCLPVGWQRSQAVAASQPFATRRCCCCSSLVS